MKIIEVYVQKNANHENHRIQTRIMKIMIILEFYMRTMKIMKIIELHMRIMKIIKMQEFRARITKIIKIMKNVEIT